MKDHIAARLLRRYWFPLPGHIGIGVTAATAAEARALAEGAREALWPRSGPLGAPVENVDVRTLDQKHVVPNVGVVTRRGVWFPPLDGGAGVPGALAGRGPLKAAPVRARVSSPPAAPLPDPRLP